MNPAFTSTLYIRLRKKVALPRNQTILLGHVAQLLAEPEAEATLRSMPLLKPSERDGSVVLIDMLQIVRHVKELYPNMQIEHFGEPNVLVEILPDSSGRVRPLVLIFALLLLFVGSGLAIMNFHEDVSMLEVHRKLYEMITGKTADHPYWLQIPYSVGLGVGMVLFFNQLFKKKFSDEPSPLEVEMFMYQESVNQYIATEEYSKMNEGRGKP